MLLKSVYCHRAIWYLFPGTSFCYLPPAHAGLLCYLLLPLVICPITMEFPGVALVTGAASGIGRATALLFAARGCRQIVIADVRDEGLQETKASISQLAKDSRVLAVYVDVRKEDSVQSMVNAAVAEFGRIDYCCNVAGITILGETAESKTSDFDLMYEINLRGVYFCERAEIRAMLRQNRLASGFHCECLFIVWSQSVLRPPWVRCFQGWRPGYI
jgi:NAD(P)-dependent dehydrogenase (short-subunit alcohol dehydrogenase family)